MCPTETETEKPIPDLFEYLKVKKEVAALHRKWSLDFYWSSGTETISVGIGSGGV